MGDPRPKRKGESLLTAALEHHRAGRHATAERLYRKALKKRPRDPKLLHLLGILAHQTGRRKMALELLERAAKMVPRNLDIRRNLTRALEAAGAREKALGALNKATGPGDASLRVELGNAYLKAGRTADVSRKSQPGYRLR